MMLITKAPRGTSDMIPQESYQWHFVEKKAREICRQFGYNEIRTPTFEHTELFLRGVGDTTDVVEKQMYTFDDKAGRSITLRPEGTASAARAYIERNLYAEPLPVKMYYIIPCYRYEKPQAGRYREFHQFGIEVFGSAQPSVDAEIISLAMAYLQELGLGDLTVNLNSIGCPQCRKEYNQRLKDYFTQHIDSLCDTCKTRLDRNPLRILDCKSPVCQELAAGAPRLLDYICDDCAQHFEAVKTYLSNMGIQYQIDPGIVRGLDYYTKTVFEVISDGITVCGGGRYDGLIGELGGPETPGIGFGLGLERLIMTMQNRGLPFGETEEISLYIANIGDAADLFADKLVFELRRAGISCEKDRMKRSLKAQMKYADKLGAHFSIVLGDDEINSGKARLKNMQTGEITEVDLKHLEKILKQKNDGILKEEV